MTDTGESQTSIKELIPVAILGFNGRVKNGLKVHPDKKHMIFPFGNKISAVHITTNKQYFFNGHNATVSTLDVSTTGLLVGSGEDSSATGGTKAFVIIWDWETKSEKCRYDIHRLLIESVCFSSGDRYLVSLGGTDCGKLVVWDVEKNQALCGAVSSKETTGKASKLIALREHGTIFVSCGDKTLRVWTIDVENRKLRAQDVLVGKIRRQYSCLQIDVMDEIIYAGTMSGDLIKVKINCDPGFDKMMDDKIPILLGCYGRYERKKPPGRDCECYKNGIRCILLLDSGEILIGSGDGLIELVAERNLSFKNYPSPTCPQLNTLKRAQVVRSAITSLQLLTDKSVIIGTEACEIWILELSTFAVKLSKTCHKSSINSIAFPHNFPYVFATAEHEIIRLWSFIKREELLRIVVRNFTATSVTFSKDGTSIISCWNDGIRSFTPLTGQLIFTIPNAHNKGCTCISISSNGKTLVSGGEEGQVRVWRLTPQNQSLVGVLKEHTAAITTVEFNKFDNEVVSSSIDGTCIIWDIGHLQRKHVLFANTQFTCARYFPTGVQILTSGSDCRITYWEVHDASMIRQVEGSTRGTINGISLNESGNHFVSVGSDQLVKLWDYQQGLPVCAGYGHASTILCCCYSPCGKFIVTGGADGSIFIWKIPEEFHPAVASSSSRSSGRAGKAGSKRKEENICNHSMKKA